MIDSLIRSFVTNGGTIGAAVAVLAYLALMFWLGHQFKPIRFRFGRKRQ